jgi:hypothetical protein
MGYSMDKQFPLSLPSVQVTYRIFLRDMLSGWIAGMMIAYGLAPKAFHDTALLISIFLLALIWSPIVGLLINTLGYMFLEWILTSSFIKFLFRFFFREQVEATETLVKKMIELAYDGNIADDKKPSLLEELKTRAHFIVRAAGWSEKDELIERVHGIMQTARTLSFTSFAFALLLGDKTFAWYENNIIFWHVLLVTGVILLLVACFLTQYASVQDIRLLYELVLIGDVSTTVIKGELPTSNKIT